MITALVVPVASISSMNISMDRASLEGTRSLPMSKMLCFTGTPGMGPPLNTQVSM